MVRTPSLVKGSEDIPLYDPVTVVAKCPKKLMVVRGTIGQTISLIVPVTKERFLTLSTCKMLYMPVFAKSCDDPFFYRSSARPTDWNIHFVVAP